MQISKNFTLAELTKTSIRGIENEPDEAQLAALTLLTNTILQPLRDKIGPVMINSGFRSEKVNKKIGGASTSQHTKGEAADIETPAMSNYELAKYIIANFDFDQLILEFASKEDPRAGWVHVSYKETGNRKSVLLAQTIKGKTVYTNGLPKWD